MVFIYPVLSRASPLSAEAFVGDDLVVIYPLLCSSRLQFPHGGLFFLGKTN
jgi:hypothetical protein